MGSARKWTRDLVLQGIKKRAEESRSLNYSSVVAEEEALGGAARRLFGSWANAVQEAGYNYQEIKESVRKAEKLPKGTWNQKKVKKEIKARAEAGKPLNPHAVQKEDPKLYSAAAGLFGSWGKAVEAAGIDYLEHRKTGSWTPEKVLSRIKFACERGADLSDVTVNALAPGLYGAATVHFGGWKQAVEAAGLDYNEVSRTVRWSRAKIIETIHAAVKQGKPLKIKNFPSSFSSAVIDHFGSWEAALKEAGYENSWQEPDKNLQNNIRGQRKACGLSETELGKMVGVTHRTISLLELGQYTDPRVSFALRLAKALNCKVEDLYCLPDREEENCSQKPGN
jgi:DNA-binding XRE family transcriptional regulator